MEKPKSEFSGLSKKEYLKKKAEDKKNVVKIIEKIKQPEVCFLGGDSFYEEKRSILSKITKNDDDRSRAGDLDIAIVPFVDMINAKTEYYTTSSCAGRSIVFHKVKDDKYRCDWIYLTHELDCNVEEIVASIKVQIAENKLIGETWFKMEPVIVAIQCHNIQAANFLLVLAKQSGLKNCGIRSISNDGSVSLVLVDTQHIEAMITLNNNLIVNQDYITMLAESAKDKLIISRQRFEKLRVLLDYHL